MPNIAMNNKEKIINLLRRGIYFAIHLGVFAAIWTGVSQASILICIGLFFIQMWAVTAGYHRYFSHKSFTTSRVFQFILAVLAQSATQRGILWWANNHREHHSNSDTPQDAHSPRQHGFWYSHVGWVLAPQNNKGSYTMVKDLEKYPELVWLDKYDMLPTIVLGIIIFLCAGWSGLAIGFCLSRVLVWNATYTINSLSHKYGTQRYNTGDDSRNNLWLALLTLGEGWHNNHHHYASSARQGFFWWEIDITYYSLKVLSWLGIVWDIKQPPKSVIENTKSATPGARQRSEKLIHTTVTSLPQVSRNLMSFTQTLKQGVHESKFSELHSRAKTLISALSLSIPHLKKLPPKLAENIQHGITQVVHTLHEFVYIIHLDSQEKLPDIIKSLENAATPLQYYLPAKTATAS